MYRYMTKLHDHQIPMIEAFSDFVTNDPFTAVMYDFNFQMELVNDIMELEAVE